MERASLLTAWTVKHSSILQTLINWRGVLTAVTALPFTITTTNRNLDLLTLTFCTTITAQSNHSFCKSLFANSIRKTIRLNLQPYKMKKLIAFLCSLLLAAAIASAQLNAEMPRLQTANGLLEDVESSGINIFKG